MPLDLTSIENGNWFYQQVPKEEIFTLHLDKDKVTYYYTYPLKVRLSQVLNINLFWYSGFCFSYFKVAMDNDPKFKAEVIKRFSKHRSPVFMGGGTTSKSQRKCTYFYTYLCGRDELAWGSLFTNLPPSEDYWLIRCYAVKDGQTLSIPVMS